jgi:hypothetical protein
MKKIILTLLAILVIGIVIAACATGRGGYETAPYTISQKDGNYEVREYPALQLATTSLNGDDKSFGRLFKYISGQNEAQEKIAMTTPVFMDGNTMSFVMPGQMKNAVPKPGAADVAIKSQPARRVASYRFSGGRSAGKEKEALRLLEEWMVKNNLHATGAPFFAYYDPPWTPGPWRRNEVLVPVRE